MAARGGHSTSWWRAAALAGTLAALAGALWLLDWRALLSLASSIPLHSVLACAAFCALTHTLIAVRWALIVTPDGGAVQWRECAVSLHASLFNLVTPSALGADVYRVLAGGERRGGRTGSAGFVLIERLLGVLGQAVVYVAAYAVLSAGGGVAAAVAPSSQGGNGVFLSPALVLTVASLAIVLVLVKGPSAVAARAGAASPALGGALRTLAGVTRYRARSLSRPVILSVAAAGFWVMAASPLALSLGLALDPLQLALVVVLTEFSRLIPLSIQGIGVREATFALLASQLGADAAVAFVVCAMTYLLNYVVVGVLGAAAAVIVARG